jgi:hypothetical protein
MLTAFGPPNFHPTWSGTVSHKLHRYPAASKQNYVAEGSVKIHKGAQQSRHTYQWRTEGGNGLNPPPPRNSEVLTKLSRIPCSVENTSITT